MVMALATVIHPASIPQVLDSHWTEDHRLSTPREPRSDADSATGEGSIALSDRAQFRRKVTTVAHQLKYREPCRVRAL